MPIAPEFENGQAAEFRNDRRRTHGPGANPAFLPCIGYGLAECGNYSHDRTALARAGLDRTRPRRDALRSDRSGKRRARGFAGGSGEVIPKLPAADTIDR